MPSDKTPKKIHFGRKKIPTLSFDNLEEKKNTQPNENSENATMYKTSGNSAIHHTESRKSAIQVLERDTTAVRTLDKNAVENESLNNTTESDVIDLHKKKKSFRHFFIFRMFFGEKEHAVFIPRIKTGVDKTILLLIFLLIGFGSVMVFSASYAYALSSFEDSMHFVKKQILWVGVGFIAMAICAKLPMSFYRRISRTAFAFTLFLLALVPIIGSSAGGAKRWLSIGVFTFQPSELAKMTLVLVLAWYFANYAQKVQCKTSYRTSFLYGIVYPFCFMLSVIMLVVLEKHLSCIIILGLITLTLMFIAGSHGKTLAGLCLGGASGVGIFALAVPYTRRRIQIWLSPELYPQHGGWQTLQGLMAIGSGGFFGVGLGNSKLKHMYVSQPQNDFIFTIACEELGFLGAISILALFAFFVYRGFVIGLNHPDAFSKFVVIGLTLKVAIQVLLNIAVVTNMLPNTGISLPFFSYGGSSLVMLFAEMGIILAASRTSNIKR